MAIVAFPVAADRGLRADRAAPPRDARSVALLDARIRFLRHAGCHAVARKLGVAPACAWLSDTVTLGGAS